MSARCGLRRNDGADVVTGIVRHCCIEPQPVILTRDLPEQGPSGSLPGSLDGGVGAPAGPSDGLARRLAGDLAVKIAGSRPMQQCPREQIIRKPGKVNA